jgi:hypothetical protein
MKKLTDYLWLVVGIALIFFNLEIQVGIDRLLDSSGLSFVSRRAIISFLTQHAVGMGWGILIVSAFRSVKGVVVLLFAIVARTFIGRRA